MKKLISGLLLILTPPTFFVYSILGDFPFLHPYVLKLEFLGIWFGLLILAIFLILLGFKDIRQKGKEKNDPSTKRERYHKRRLVC